MPASKAPKREPRASWQKAATSAVAMSRQPRGSPPAAASSGHNHPSPQPSVVVTENADDDAHPESPPPGYGHSGGGGGGNGGLAATGSPILRSVSQALVGNLGSDDAELDGEDDVHANFWEPGGEKAALRRLEHGNIVCTDLQKMMKQRADIEKSYAKELEKWSEKWIGWTDQLDRQYKQTTVMDSLVSAWQLCHTTPHHIPADRPIPCSLHTAGSKEHAAGLLCPPPPPPPSSSTFLF